MRSPLQRISFSLILVGILTSCIGSSNLTEDKNFTLIPAIIPQPASIKWAKGTYTLPENNIICYNQGSFKAANWASRLLRKAGLEVKTVKDENCGNFRISLIPKLKQNLGKEGYSLKISNDGIDLQSATEAGLFYGVQTLRQFFPSAIEIESLKNQKIKLRHVNIKDKPLYSWRGTMLDVARSFFGLEYLKRHVDRMAFYKLNRLHLHLTDDQGWRIEIKNKPKLTEIGSKGSVRNGRSGFLTQNEYKELQEYALARNIIIIPEIDMPGHIYSALISYPELNCEGFSNLNPKRASPPELFSNYNVSWSKFCLDKPEVYDFVSEVIKEVSDITEGPWIHIGGDEIKDDRYKDFVVKADSIVRSYGKTTIGWEEVTQAEVDTSLISQEWRGTVEGVVNVKVIQSLCSQFYFDHANIPGQENTNNWCQEFGVSLEDVYSFRNNNPKVIGVEAPVWSEFVLSDTMMDNRFWPRTVAVSEVGWSPKENLDFIDFKTRLGKHGERLQLMGINFFRSPGISWNTINKMPGVFSGFMPISK